MSRKPLKTICKRYFQRLLFAIIYFLFFLPQQSQAQCNSIYDRIVSGYHSTLAVKTDGKIALWGENMGYGFVNQLTPWELSPLDPATAIMGTVGGGSDGGYDQVIVLTSVGLYALGYNTGAFGSVLPTNLTPSTNFEKITQPSGGNSYGLPDGILPDDVASIFATYKTLLIVTKNGSTFPRNGSVWIITQTSQAVEANGGVATSDVTSSSWKRVMINSGTALTNITAARGQISPIPSSSQYYSAFMALAANGNVYTWGNSTYLGDGSDFTARSFATMMNLPPSETPKMIGVTGGTKNVINSSAAYAKNTYYLLCNSGSLYTLGDNSKRQCGDFSTDERKSWGNVKSSISTNFTNINFISVQEHTSGIPCASAITSDGKLYTWGEDDGGMLARGTTSAISYDPGVALGSGGSTALFSEMGGHTLIYLKMGSERFCYVGHKSRGTMGDSYDWPDKYLTSFDCDNGPIISICGSVSALVIPSDPGIITGPTPVCPAASGYIYSINPVANAATYVWSVPTGWIITAGQGTNSITVTAGSFGQNGNISVYARNNFGRSDAESTLAVTVSERPSPTFTTQAGVTICANTDVTYTTQSNQTNYLWTIPGILNTDYTITSGDLSSTSNSVTLKWLTTGSKIVAINYSNSNNCNASSATSSNASMVNARSTPTFTVQPGAAVCANTDVTYTTQSNQTNYLWTIPGILNTDYTITSGGTTSSNSVTLKWLTAGIKTVTINYSNSNNCNALIATSSTSTTVNASATPTFTTQPGSTACINADVTYTTESGQSNYLWTIPGIPNNNYSITSGGTSSSNTVTLKWLTTGVKTVTINYTNSNSCSAAVVTSSTATTVSARPTPTFTTQPGANNCASNAVTYATQPGQLNYIWTLPGTINTDYIIISGGIGTSDYTVTLKWLTAGSKTVTINYSNSSNCNASVATSSTPTVVNVKIPTFTVQPGATVCTNTNATYTTESAQSNYSWGVPGTLNTDYTITSGGISSSSNTVTLKWLTAGSKTVTINYSNSNNCNLTVATSSIPTTVSARPVPSFSIQPGATACVSGNITYTTESGQSNYLWTVPGVLNTDYSIVTGDLGTTSNSVTLKWLTAGVKTVTINYTNSNNCNALVPTSSTATTVIAKPTPTFTIQPGANACVNANVTYTTESGQNSYLWTLPGIENTDYTIISGGIGSTNNTVTLKWLTAGVKTVTINYNNSNNCTAISATSSIATTVSARSTPTFTTQPGVATCSNSDVTYTTESSQSNYIWTFSGILNTDYSITSGGTTSSNTVTLKWLTAGVKTVTINYTNSNNCNAEVPTSSIPTTVTARPVPSFSTQPGATACVSSDVTYTSEIAQSNYLWTVPGVLNTDYSIVTGDLGTTSNSVTLKWLTTGIKTVTINYTNSNNCTAVLPTSSTSTSVITKPNPTFIIQPGANACVNASVTYTTESGQNNYVWTLPGTINTDYTIISGGIGTTNNTVTLKWLTTGSKTVMINYDVNFCTAVSATSSTATTVSARSTPTFTTQPGSAICSNSDVTYSTESSQSNYIWTFSGTLNTDYSITSGGTTSSNIVTLKWLTAGVKTVTINYTNSNNCNAEVSTSSTATTVSARPLPTFTTQPGATACVGGDVSYATESGQANYLWILTGTLNTDYSITSGGVDNASNTVTLKWLTAGVKTVTINYTNSNNCNALVPTLSTATTVSGRPVPTFTIQPGATVCAYTNVTYTTEPGQTSYVWTGFGTLNTDYSITSGGVDNASNTVTLKWLTAGVKTIAINYSNSNNCSAVSATSSSATTVNAAPTPSFIAQPGAIACPNADITYTTEPGNTNYTWTIPGAQYIDYFISGGSTTSNTVTLKWLTTGTKTATINYTNSNSCIAASPTSSIPTVVNALPSPSFISEAGATACPGIDVTYSTQSNQSNYIWTIPGILNTDYTITSGGTTSSNTLTLKWLTTGSKTVTINYSNSNNCTAASATSSTATTVKSINTVGNASSTPTICINTAITNITHLTTGATGISGSGITGTNGLPAGVSTSWTSNTITISGTPSSSGIFNYSIPLTGGCGVITATGTISVTANNTVTRTSAAGTVAQTVCINTAMTPITYSTIGATGATVSNLPTGVTGNWANNLITISGIPSVAGSALTYTITLTGGCGLITTTGTITVSANNTATRSSALATETQTVCINTAISNITYATTVATGANVTNLPSGLTSSWANNILIISGTPTVAGSAKTYTVNLTGGCGVFTTTGTVAVTSNNTVTRTSAASTIAQTVCINSAITSITYSTTGATGASFTGLPTGVTGVWSNNVITISGTPSISVAAQTYTVTLTGGCGVITTTGTITVLANNTLTRTSAVATDAQSVCANTAMTPIIYATTIATGATVTNLPSGITSSWSNNVLTISGTPTVVGSALTYTITLTGGCSVVTTTGTIAVKPKNTIALSSLVGTDNQLKCINTAIDNITYNTTGATGANFTGLPVGVSGVWSNDAIVLSGSPSISGSFNYKISLIGGCAIADKSGDINVTPENTITLSSAATTDSQSICIGKNITAIEYTTVGATGFTITGLPTGVQAVFQSNKIKITGTPSVTGVFNYTISLVGGCGLVNKNGTVIINSLPTGTIAASNNGVICEGSNVILTATGGNTYEWNLNNNPIAGAVAANYSATVAGLYSVKLISDKGCINFVQQTATLVLNNAPVVGYSFDKYCINTPIVFTNSSTTNLSGPVTMLWDFGDNGISSSTSPTHSFLLEKTYAVKLTITPTNCPLIAKSLSKNIKIEVPPLAIRYPNVFALKNTNTKLTARSIGKTYSWSPSIGLSNTSTISPNFNFSAATNYVIKITNDAGCIFNDSLNVLIFDKADFFVPNAFSPNNDGRNDKLLIAAPGIETFQYFRIFNRWGNLVFETSNSSVFWDGTFKGMAQPAEVYSWFAEGISKSGNKIQRNGQTLILR